jgi:EpsI family protein
MVLAMIFPKYISHGEETKLIKPFSYFPKEIGQWNGLEGHFDQDVYDELGVDDSYLANYYNPNGNYVQVYIGYYESQKEGEQIHSPKNCMPGGGWNITQTAIEEITIKGNNPNNVKVIKLLLEKGIEKQLVLYWYQSGGRFISSEYWQRIYMVIDSITKNRTDGSFIRLITPISDNNEEVALESLKEFTALLIPILKEYIPS